MTLFNARKPSSTSAIARLAGLPRNTTYYHLELLRKQGLALRNGKLWICQPFFVDGAGTDLVLSAYTTLALAVVDKMVVPPGVSQIDTLRGCLQGLAQLFDIPTDDSA